MANDHIAGKIVKTYAEALHQALAQVHPNSYDLVLENLEKELAVNNHMSLLPEIEKELESLLNDQEGEKVQENSEFIEKLNNFINQAEVDLNTRGGITMVYEEESKKSNQAE